MGRVGPGVKNRVLAASILLLALRASSQAEDTPVFRSEVSLVRVDVQVDYQNRAVTTLNREDFVLKEQGRSLEIRNFVREEMPVDVLILLDVSGSMRPHVERVANASSAAMNGLARGDRVALMVFDRRTRLRMPFRSNLDTVENEFQLLLSQETFDGGTDISRGLYDAIDYINKSGRKEARRAIVILTDDQTQRGSDPDGVSRALAEGDIVLSLLLTPDALRNQRGGGWPGGGNGGPGPIIFGRRGPWPGGGGNWPGGGGGNGPVIVTRNTESARTDEVARASGGDVINVDRAAAFETTLARLRQRYALYFNLPPDAREGQQRWVEVELAPGAARRYPNADVRYRRTYVPTASGNPDAPVELSGSRPADRAPAVESQRPAVRRRPVNEESRGPSGPYVAGSATAEGGWKKAESTPAPSPTPAAAATPATSQPSATKPEPERGGWPRVEDYKPAPETPAPAPASTSKKKKLTN
jgi:hypothetical protein